VRRHADSGVRLELGVAAAKAGDLLLEGPNTAAVVAQDGRCLDPIEGDAGDVLRTPSHPHATRLFTGRHDEVERLGHESRVGELDPRPLARDIADEAVQDGPTLVEDDLRPDVGAQARMASPLDDARTSSSQAIAGR